MKVFIEEQKFTNTIAIVGIAIAFIVSSSILISNWSEIEQGSTSEKIATFSGIIIILLVALLFYKLSLKTRIDEKGIHYQFYPFHLKPKCLLWKTILNFKVISYNPILDYGGWGIRYNFLRKKGKAYTVKGNIGLKIELKNGKKILIGTQIPEKLQLVINHYKNKLNYEN